MSMTLSVSALDEAFLIVRLRAGSVARTRTGYWIDPDDPPQTEESGRREKESPAIPALFQRGGRKDERKDNDRREDPGRDAPEGRGKIDPDRDEGQGERGPERDGQDAPGLLRPLTQGSLALERRVDGAVHEEGAETEKAEDQREGPEQGEEAAREFRPGVERHTDDHVPERDAEEQGRKGAPSDEGRLPELLPDRVMGPELERDRPQDEGEKGEHQGQVETAEDRRVGHGEGGEKGAALRRGARLRFRPRPGRRRR